jgi:hypothetical protein
MIQSTRANIASSDAGAKDVDDEAMDVALVNSSDANANHCL